MDCNVLIKEKRQRRASGIFGDAFDDPFFDQFFGNVREKRVTLRSEDATVKILSLPEDGKPSDFSGAIGRFEMMVDADPREVSVGDPITIKTSVMGTGNFDRIQAPRHRDDESFRTYAPTSKTDSASSNTKVFEQVVIPQNGNITEIPSLKFSFFDPENRKYVTLTSSPVPIKVKPVANTPPPTPATSTSPPPIHSTNSSLQSGDEGILPTEIKSDFRRYISRIYHHLKNPIFWKYLGSVIFTLFFLIWGFKRYRIYTSDPHRMHRQKMDRAIQKHLKKMNSAARRGQTDLFFSSMRCALQERFGGILQLAPETITLAEIEKVMSVNPENWSEIKAIFEAADAVAYSGQKFDIGTSEEWKKRLQKVLVELKKISCPQEPKAGGGEGN